MSANIALPEQLAPALVVQVRALLDQVSLTTAPPVSARSENQGPLCVVCHRGGRLGGHHEPDGSVSWIHRSCHRRLHQRFRGPRRPRRS